MADDSSTLPARYANGRFGPSDGLVLSEEELVTALTRAQELYDGSGDRRAALAELEAILLGEPRNEADHH